MFKSLDLVKEKKLLIINEEGYSQGQSNVVIIVFNIIFFSFQSITNIS